MEGGPHGKFSPLRTARGSSQASPARSLYRSGLPVPYVHRPRQHLGCRAAAAEGTRAFGNATGVRLLGVRISLRRDADRGRLARGQVYTRP